MITEIILSTTLWLFIHTSKALKIESFQVKKFDIFLICAQHIDCGYTLEPPTIYVLETKIRKIGIPLQTPVLLYKSGVQGGIHYTDMFS